MHVPVTATKLATVQGAELSPPLDCVLHVHLTPRALCHDLPHANAPELVAQAPTLPPPSTSLPPLPQYNDWGPGGVTAQPAPPLVDEADIEQAPPAAMASARSAPTMSRPSMPGVSVPTRGTGNAHGLPRHGSTGVGLGHYGMGPAGAAAAVVGADRTALAASVNDVDFGLAACLATPMDPGSGVEAETRLVSLPSATTTATTTAAAR